MRADGRSVASWRPFAAIRCAPADGVAEARRAPAGTGARRPVQAGASPREGARRGGRGRLPRRAQAGEPDEKRRSSGESTSTDLVRSTNGSPAIRSSTRSKCRMSEVKTCTSASASPVTVDADTTSG